MAAPKLTKEEQATVIRLLSEGEPYSFIAEKVKCSYHNVNYYAIKYSVEIEAAREEYNRTIINQGFANKEYRIRKLARLAKRIEDRLETSLDATDTKIAGNGSTVDVDYFNAPEVNAYRAIMDDIAKEKGERQTRTDITTNGESLKVIVGIDLDKV